MPDSQTFNLTDGPDTVSGGAGVNTIIATDGTLSAGDQIDAGDSGANILSLQGGGTFDLTQPPTLTNIAVVDAEEGTDTSAGNTIQTVIMRPGLNVTVNVATAVNGEITIFGAADADVFNLGGGADVVTLGSAAESVNGGGGAALVNMTAATAGALITGKGGTTTLGLSGGGTVTLNAADSGVTLIKLEAATTGYDLVTNDQPNLIITDNSTTADTIVLNSASDELIGKSASVTAQVTAANAGVLVFGRSGPTDVLDITTGGTAELNPSTSKVAVVLEQATDLTLNNYITDVTGSSGNDTVTITAANVKATTSFNGGGGSNTLILDGGGTFRWALPTTLANFSAIDVFEGTNQIIKSRAGLAATIDVGAAPSGATDDAITLDGAADSAVFNLGAGIDTVNLGSSAETVNGGAGTAIITAKAAAAGALIQGGSGTTTLTVSGGGTATLNAGDSGIATVDLASTASAYHFTANAEAGLRIDDLGHGADTITLGGADQTVTGGAHGKLTIVGSDAGYDTIIDSAAIINADTIGNFQHIGDVIDVTNLDVSKIFGTFTENAADTSARLFLSDGTHSFSVVLAGQYMKAGTSGDLPAAGLHVTADGEGGTDITYGAAPTVLDGSAGNQVVTANAAADTLIGGSGDTLNGAADGGDTFVFHTGFGPETVDNFVATGTNHDVLQFDTSVFADWAHLLGATTQQGSDLAITLDPGDVITLKNVSLASFTSADAHFV